MVSYIAQNQKYQKLKNNFVCRFHVISFAGSDLITDSKLEKRWHSIFFLKISLTFNKWDEFDNKNGGMKTIRANS